MAVIFPNSPTLNQEVVGDNNVVYVWDGQKWKSVNAGAQHKQVTFQLLY